MLLKLKSYRKYDSKHGLFWLFILIGNCALVTSYIWGRGYTAKESKLPEGWTYATDYCYSLKVHLMYATKNNFMGRVLPGYKEDKHVAITTIKAAERLAEVQRHLGDIALGLKILDAYRPYDAILAFKNWSQSEEDYSTKEKYYPNIDKKDLYKLGFFSEKSDHNRGSTVDVTLVNLGTWDELDMGTRFDFFDTSSEVLYDNLTEVAKRHREMLSTVMELYGFRHNYMEWWHYWLVDEPITKKSVSTPFNFPVE